MPGAEGSEKERREQGSGQRAACRGEDAEHSHYGTEGLVAWGLGISF